MGALLEESEAMVRASKGNGTLHSVIAQDRLNNPVVKLNKCPDSKEGRSTLELIIGTYNAGRLDRAFDFPIPRVMPLIEVKSFCRTYLDSL
jgi:hypothetical protein